ncbi:uncharacterized protein TNCV_814731 [Trichonephila clavipes]|nr:uncharacterized protein TNCV_814731 [Trichonephila clavipes]
MAKFETPYRMLKVQNNNLTVWKRGRRVTVNVRIYHPRLSNTNSFYSTNETLYEGNRSSNRSSKSHPGKSRSSRKPSGDESKSRKSTKGTVGLEDLRLKRKVGSNKTEWRGMIESGSKYAGNDLFRGPNMETRKDKHLYWHRG